jgi:hypothetical protein
MHQSPEGVLAEVAFQQAVEVPFAETLFHEGEDLAGGVHGLVDLFGPLSAVEIKSSVPVAAALGHLLDEQRGEHWLQRGIVYLEFQAGMHGHAAAGCFQAGFLGRLRDAFLNFGADLVQVGGNIAAAEFADGGQGGAEAERVAPIGAGDEHPARRFHDFALADHRAHRVAVRDRLGEYRHVRRHTHVSLNAADVDPKAAGDFIEDEHRAMLTRELGHSLQVTRRRHLGAQGLHDDGSHLAAVVVE